MKSKQILSKGSESPENFKLYGIADTLENILCVPKNENCPITINQTYNNYNNYDYENNSSINVEIISLFKLKEYSVPAPCMNPKEKKWISYSILEEKKNCKIKFFGELNDNRYNRYQKISIINTTKKEL